MPGGGGRGPNWGGVGAGIAAGIVGGLILQGIANANTPPDVIDDIDDGPPSRQRVRRPPPNRAANNRVSGAPPAGETRFVPDEVVVEIPNTMAARALGNIERRHRLSRLDMRRSTLRGATLVRWRVADGRSVPAVIRALEREGGIAAAQPNYVYTLQQTEMPARPASPAGGNSAVSDDPASGGSALRETPSGDATAPAAASQSQAVPPQYALAKMNVAQAHAIARGDGVLVAVIDSGIDDGHPALRGAVAERFNAAETPPDAHAHGTGIAGLIAARGSMTGIAPEARILAVRAFDPKGGSAEGTTFAILKGLDWSAERRAGIVNMSFAGPADPALGRALAAAARRGIILIAAAGNAGAKSPPLFPAADRNVIAVTATDAADDLFERANRGRHIAVAAPGVDIVAPSSDGAFQVASGTSMAAAQVSGIAALLLQRKSNLGAVAVRGILSATAKDLGPAGHDDQFGSGLADAYQATMAAEAKTARARPIAGGRPN
jgi:subtilisin family serine protease